LRLPVSFIESIQNAKGFSKEAFEEVHAGARQITSVRVNPGKIFNLACRQEGIQPCLPAGRYSVFNSQSEKVPWSSNGFYLAERPSFTADPLFHAGAYYVQEASSMFLEEALRQTVDLSQPIKVLDLCAAPGGKSTLIQSLINADSVLVSNEVIKTRVNILSENITKWGAANVIVTNNDAKDFQRLPGYFDVIVVDAPCSGSGLFRKDPEAISEWSEQNVQLCSQRQQRILADVLPALNENGILLYSTCSYSEEEDEQVADWLLEEFKVESLKMNVDAAPGVVETQSPKHHAFGYRFYPDKVKGEGFFIAAFKKGNDQPAGTKPGKQKAKAEKLSSKDAAILTPYVKNAEDYFFFKQKDEVIAMPKALEPALADIQNALYIKKAGVKMGAIIRNELIPDHELAVSTIIDEQLTSIEAGEAAALQYLRKQAFSIDTTIKGWALIKFNQLPLGWVKILPNRINNYYPKDWRILNK
jgi:NOL1/NOP2/sun family putative RNA methylase